MNKLRKLVHGFQGNIQEVYTPDSFFVLIQQTAAILVVNFIPHSLQRLLLVYDILFKISLKRSAVPTCNLQCASKRKYQC